MCCGVNEGPRVTMNNKVKKARTQCKNIKIKNRGRANSSQSEKRNCCLIPFDNGNGYLMVTQQNTL